MPIVREYIGTGDKAIYRTLEKMQQFAQEDSQSDVIKKIGTEIIRDCGGDMLCRAKSAFKYIIDNVKYIFDDELAKKLVPGIKNPKSKEVLVRPAKLLTDIKEGDCDDMATALAALTMFLRIPTFFKVIDWKKGVGFSHVYLILKINGKEYPADPVKKTFNWEKKPVNRSNQCEIQNGECNMDYLQGNVKGMSGLADVDACVKETFNRTNYNAGCINAPCYSMEYVTSVIAAYSGLLKEGLVKTYDRNKYKDDDLKSIEKAVAVKLNDKEEGRVSAVLYNMFYGITDGLKKENDKFKDCEILIKKKMSPWIWFGAGLLVTGVGSYLYLRHRNQAIYRKNLSGIRRAKKRIESYKKRGKK